MFTTALAIAIRVLIIDTGVTSNISYYYPYLVSSQVDQHGHGTHVTGLVLFGGFDSKGKPIEKLCDNVIVDVCPLLIADNGIEKCLDLYKNADYDFINYSGGGSTFNKVEFDAIKRTTEAGSVFVVAAGNEGRDVRNTFYPASYKYMGMNNFIVVGNGYNNRDKASTSNYGEDLRWMDGDNILSLNGLGNFQRMSGTSQATALYTHSLVMKLCKERNETNNGLFTQFGSCH